MRDGRPQLPIPQKFPGRRSIVRLILLSTLTGFVAGFVFSLFRLPIPAPPALAGIFGIIGIYLGYQAYQWVSRFF